MCFQTGLLVVTTCLLIGTASTQFIDPWCLHSLDQSPPQTKMVFGERTLKGEVQYQTQILWYGELICSGALIQVGQTQAVLTSASCVDVPDHFFIAVQGSDWDLEVFEQEQVREVDQIYIPDNYNKSRPYENDIALILLTEPFNLDNLTQPIALPRQGEELPENRTLKACGWGPVLPLVDELNCKLLKVDIPVVDTEICQQVYNEHGVEVKDNMFCTGLMDGGVSGFSLGPCGVDFGGPLVDTETGTMVGIMSHNPDCGYVGSPDVNTKVSHFVSWIEAKLNATSDV